VFPIVLPPLRERGEDIDLLADLFLDAVNGRERTNKAWSPEARALLRSHTWPGNVRELKNVVERAAILADSSIGPELVPAPQPAPPRRPAAPGAVLHVRVGSSLEDVERRLILATLNELKGDKRRTAQALGIGLKTLYTRLSLYRATGLIAPAEHASPATVVGAGSRESFVESAAPDRPMGSSDPR
jgi:DNA-binding NtrC family response regulator